jgi:hypothetical protein
LIMQSSSNEVSQFGLPGQDIGLKCLLFDWATNLSRTTSEGESVN